MFLQLKGTTINKTINLNKIVEISSDLKERQIYFYTANCVGTDIYDKVKLYTAEQTIDFYDRLIKAWRMKPVNYILTLDFRNGEYDVSGND